MSTIERSCPKETGITGLTSDTAAFHVDVLGLMKPGALTIYMGKPEIPVGKSNGSHSSV